MEACVVFAWPTIVVVQASRRDSVLPGRAGGAVPGSFAEVSVVSTACLLDASVDPSAGRATQARQATGQAVARHGCV